MAIGDETTYTIVAPPDATLQDVQRLTVEVYLSEENPPEYVVAEALGNNPEGQSVWAVTVRDGPETVQDGSEDDDPMHPGSDTIYGDGGP